MITRKNIEEEMVIRCLDEMYQASQPPITWKEFLEKQKKTPEDCILNQHYLSQEVSNYIIEKYIDFYNLLDKFDDHCELLIHDMDGCSKDKYIEPKDGSPGYRSYEKVPSLAESIGEENLQKVKDFIRMRKNFYRYNRKADSFRFTVWNYSPCTSLKAVVDYYTKNGTPIEIIETPKEYLYEKYYLGASDEEIQRLIEEEDE